MRKGFELLDEVLKNFSTRTKYCLLNADIYTLDSLLELEPYELLRFRNFGKKSYKEVTDYIHSLGHEFGQGTKNIRMTPELYKLLVQIKKHSGTYTDLIPLINDLRNIL